jgi:hypothetical protein
MRKFIRNPFIVLVLLIVGLITACCIFFKTCTHEVTHKGIVISHHTTSDRDGNIEYYTIATFDDNKVRSIHGLDYYIVEVGGTVFYTETYLNK